MKWARKRGRKKKRRKRGPTPGSFKPGPDPRRHVFTPSDCRVGWLVANILHPELREYLRMKLWCFYGGRARRAKEKAHGAKKKRRARGPRARVAGDDTRDNGVYAGGYSDADIPF